MSTEVLTPRTRDDWLQERKPTIGASESPALLGVHPYLTLRELYALKSGELADSRPETPAMRRGRFVEQVAVDFLQEERPDWTVTANRIPGGKFFRDLDIGLSATPDAFITDPGREGFGVCQIKSVEPHTFEDKWGGEDNLHVPNLLAIQAIQEAILSGASYAYGAALIISHGIDMHLIEIPIHEGIFARLKTEALDFWRRVKDHRPPDFDFNRDIFLIGRLYASPSPGKEIDLSGRNDLPELVGEDAKLSATIKLAKTQRDRIKARFLSEMRDAEIARYNGEIIATAKQVQKKEHWVKAHNYRQITLKGGSPMEEHA